MRMLVLTPKFKREFRKFVKRNAELQQRIEDTLEHTETNSEIIVLLDIGTHDEVY